MKKIALIDNYDSFTWNLVHLLEKSGNVQVDVYMNDRVDLQTLQAYDNLVISPGPGLPKDAGITPTTIAAFYRHKHILGVCLGMQAIGEHFGSGLKNLSMVMHGITTPVMHLGNDSLFDNVPATFNAGRYHSWVVEAASLHPDLQVLATDTQGELMAIRHRHYAIHAVQFHPESILSEHGETIAHNWITTL